MKEFIFVVGFGTRTKKKKGNFIRFIVAKNLFVVGFGTRTKKKKGNGIRFVVAKNLFVVGFGTRTKKKRKETAFVLSWPRIYLWLDFVREQKEKKGNVIRFVVAKNLFVVGLGTRTKKKRKETAYVLSWPRIYLWLDLVREQKKRKETAFVLSWPRIYLWLDLAREQKKKEKKLHPFYRAQEFILRLDLAR